MAIQTEIVKRFFAGDYSRKEYRQFLEEIKSNRSEENIKQTMEAHWAEFCDGPLPDGNVDYIFQKIRHRIRLEENQKPVKNRFGETFRRVAAILIIPLLLSFLAYLWFQPGSKASGEAYAEIQCPMGVRTKFSLPDGSAGYLNSGSILKFPARFEGERWVELTGEAYFEIRHDKKSPFHVHTKNLDIKVLGTTFNVISYPDEINEEVILLAGSIDVSEDSGNHIGILSPGRQLVYNAGKHKSTEKEVEASQYTSWTEGKLVFRNEDMEQVAKRLSRWYNADIQIADPLLKNYSFHATFVDEQLDEVLRLLSITTPISFSEEKRAATPEGVYQKRKIFLKINPEKINEFK